MTQTTLSPSTPPRSTEAEAGAYRSGVAARLAGLPVETLRVWERRYGVSEPARSAHGQRLYSGAQVRRLALVKQLVDQGHPIRALARLPLQQLQQLSEPLAAPAQARSIRLALVGAPLARRLAASGADGLALQLLRSCASLDDAAEAMRGLAPDVLLIEAAELVDAALPLIAAVRLSAGASAVVVLYRFCSSATIRQLRALGCLVARTPADLPEIVMLCQAALGAQAPAARAANANTAANAAAMAAPVEPAPLPAPPPRQLDDQALAAIVGAVNSVSCECPRHLAEILLTVGSFERYSAQCAARDPADARLHQELNLAAGQARALLEAAMQRLARAEGLPLPAGL
ncbi:MerR family transcriptional regulator [Rugamonas rubra]|uniref:DNA-binding transcriptional regulator, MerR family n=1 Tax=Rugamonas rubra TaxID=758825 RepID=A0A1I4QH96_9BURK|nr:MerR family transcriptional regulator [Rugamonas rubra]SFM39397.1 DNA-binding transcriptional regulator, MerR family [Rugamonas rubra]